MIFFNLFEHSKVKIVLLTGTFFFFDKMNFVIASINSHLNQDAIIVDVFCYMNVNYIWKMRLVNFSLIMNIYFIQDLVVAIFG